MDSVLKAIPKQFIEEIPQGIKLIKRETDTFLVVESLGENSDFREI